METKLKMVYWKGEKFWVGKLIDHPEVMTQGKTLKELEENIIDAYKLLVLDEVPETMKAKRLRLQYEKKGTHQEINSCRMCICPSGGTA